MLSMMMVVVAWIPAVNIYITLTVCKPGTVPNAACTAITHGTSPARAVLFAHFTDGEPTAQRLGGLPETHGRQVSKSVCASVNLTPGGCEMGSLLKPHRGGVVGAGQSPRQGTGRTLSLARRGPMLALSPRGQALQGKQKSVVSTVPNPKWLLPNCNPIKVRLVYLSSLGLFITVQMAATFGRLSSSLPAARHAKLSSTESGLAPVRGHVRQQPARRVLCLPLCAHIPPLRVADGAGSTLPPPQCQQQGPAAPGVAPLITPVAGAPGKEETAVRSSSGEWRGQRGLSACMAPHAQCQAA